MFALAVQKFFRQALKQDESSYIRMHPLKSFPPAVSKTCKI
ncbi:hypothetical protein HMPREF9406_0307 [Clostridium sp. HGF2]|nr:hypothetical protein HMPREF9406_0307 [Clostridium sp. HGF2]EQJ52952.1 hypothetical protein QSI_3787 [Clostridioides difficile P28]